MDLTRRCRLGHDTSKGRRQALYRTRPPKVFLLRIGDPLLLKQLTDKNMKIIGRGTIYNSSYGEHPEDKFIIEATRGEILELGSFGEKLPLNDGLVIEIKATRARLNAIKNMKLSKEYNSALEALRELLKDAEGLDGAMVTMREEAKAINSQA